VENVEISLSYFLNQFSCFLPGISYEFQENPNFDQQKQKAKMVQMKTLVLIILSVFLQNIGSNHISSGFLNQNSITKDRDSEPYPIFESKLNDKSFKNVHAFSTPIPSNLQQGLLAAYFFSGNANDESGGGSNGVVINSVSVVDRFGVSASAYSFDGSSAYITAPGGLFSYSQDLSISLWIKPTNVVGRVIDHAAAPNSGMHMTYASSKLVLTYFTSGSTSAFTGLTLVLNHWNHVLFVKAGTTLISYLNGVAVGPTKSGSATVSPNTNVAFVIGANDVGTAIQDYSTGVLDDIFIYNRALTASEIAQLYTYGTPTAAPSTSPSIVPSYIPSAAPTLYPTAAPSVAPTLHPTACPSAAPTFGPTATPTAAPSVAPSTIPSLLPTPVPSLTPTTVPSFIPSERPSEIPSISPTFVPTTTPSEAPSVSPSVDPTACPSGAPTIGPTATPTAAPSTIPSLLPTPVPSRTPSAVPSFIPSERPSEIPSISPTFVPTTTPSEAPSVSPSVDPTACPSGAPTIGPTATPTAAPSTIPSLLPTPVPSRTPSAVPSFIPSERPSEIPSISPTFVPTTTPSEAPSVSPSVDPTACPSGAPTFIPTAAPGTVSSTIPSFLPTAAPGVDPTFVSTVTPSEVPKSAPTFLPTTEPSFIPSEMPSFLQSMSPSKVPTASPTGDPSAAPTLMLSPFPSEMPSAAPIFIPTAVPSEGPSANPTLLRTATPSEVASLVPSEVPSVAPSFIPTMVPSEVPTTSPTTAPTETPSQGPSAAPAFDPTATPSEIPSVSPTYAPAVTPSELPSVLPTFYPTAARSEVPSATPFFDPTAIPSGTPTFGPSVAPIGFPSVVPTFSPTPAPNEIPSETPTCNPTVLPSEVPSVTPTLLTVPSATTDPIVNINIPAVLAQCTPLLLDLSSSTGNIGRSWERGSIVAVALVKSGAAVEALNQFLATSYSIYSPVPIPSSYLTVGVIYSFEVTLCNYRQRCAHASRSVEIVSSAVPTVTIDGSNLRFVQLSGSINLVATATVSSCDGATLGGNSLGIVYQWSVYDTTEDDEVLLPLESVSKDPTRFSLPRYSLSVGRFFKVMVETSFKGQSSSSSVRLVTVPGSVVAIIQGGKNQVVKIGSSITVDGSKSYDEDTNGLYGLSSGLSYNWTCSQLTPSSFNDCRALFDLSAVQMHSNSETVILSPLSSLSSLLSSSATPYSAKVTLVVSDGEKKRTAATSVVITVLPAMTATISLQANSVVPGRNVINSNRNLLLKGVVALPAGLSANLTWSSSFTDDVDALPLRSMALSPLTSAIRTSFSPQSTSVNVKFAPNVFKDGFLAR
jgi:hypothetical protein